MRTTILIEQTTTKAETTAASCDFCGKPFDTDSVKQGFFNTIEIKTGYGSKHDGFVFSGEICDGCIDTLFASKLRKEEEGYL